MGVFLLGNVPTYTGLLASRARMLFGSFGSGSSQSMSRSGHVATTNITFLKLVFQNWAPGNPDTSIGANQSITASIEYPAGTFTQVKFGGIATGTNLDFGILVSDLLTINIPSGATFWVRQWTSGAIYYNSWNNSFFGEYWAGGATVTDQTMSGTLTGSAVNSAPPLMILGPTTQPSALIVGDSISYGTNDTEDSSATINGYGGKVGTIARSLGSVPFLNLGISGMQATTWIANSRGKKGSLALGGSHLITELGVNDLTFGRTSAQLTSDLQSIWALGTGIQKIYQTTITPVAPSSTDSYATVGGQTPQSTSIQNNKIAFNNAVKAILPGTAGYYDVESVYESSLNSTIWKAPGYTTDGTHPANSTIYELVDGAGVVSPVSWP